MCQENKLSVGGRPAGTERAKETRPAPFRCASSQSIQRPGRGGLSSLVQDLTSPLPALPAFILPTDKDMNLEVFAYFYCAPVLTGPGNGTWKSPLQWRRGHCS